MGSECCSEQSGLVYGLKQCQNDIIVPSRLEGHLDEPGNKGMSHSYVQPYLSLCTRISLWHDGVEGF